MLTKILAISVFAVGLATSAMAQSSDGNSAQTRHHRVPANQEMKTVDPNTTGSITRGNAGMGMNNPGPAEPCASNAPGPRVNDHYCDK